MYSDVHGYGFEILQCTKYPYYYNVRRKVPLDICDMLTDDSKQYPVDML